MRSGDGLVSHTASSTHQKHTQVKRSGSGDNSFDLTERCPQASFYVQTARQLMTCQAFSGGSFSFTVAGRHNFRSRLLPSCKALAQSSSSPGGAQRQQLNFYMWITSNSAVFLMSSCETLTQSSGGLGGAGRQQLHCPGPQVNLHASGRHLPGCLRMTTKVLVGFPPQQCQEGIDQSRQPHRPTLQVNFAGMLVMHSEPCRLPMNMASCGNECVHRKCTSAASRYRHMGCRSVLVTRSGLRQSSIRMESTSSMIA